MKIRVKWDLGGDSSKTSKQASASSQASKELPPPKREDEFVLDWNKQLGWKHDPFLPSLSSTVTKLIAGYEKERMKLNLFVLQKYTFATLVGNEGMGKTTVLRWMHEELNKHSSQIYTAYIDGATLRGERYVVHNLIRTVENIIETLITKPHKKLTSRDLHEYLQKKLEHKRLVLLIDNANEMSDFALVILKKLYMSQLPVQMIFADEKISLDIDDLKGKEHLNIALKGLETKEMEEMIRKRIVAAGGMEIYPFTSEVISMVHKKSSSNPAHALSILQHVATEMSLKKWYEHLQSLKKEETIYYQEQRRRHEEEQELMSKAKGIEPQEVVTISEQKQRRKKAESELNNFFADVMERLE